MMIINIHEKQDVLIKLKFQEWDIIIKIIKCLGHKENPRDLF